MSKILAIKSIYPIYRSGDNKFRIGAQMGVSVEINDHNNEFWDLCHLLNGDMNIDEVIKNMKVKHAKLSDQDVLDGIKQLDNLNFMEELRPNEFDDNSSPLYRYEGNVNYFGHFCSIEDDKADIQRQLLKSRVLLLGLGGIGSNILPLLASAGVGNITCVDYDSVEVSNLNRQYLFNEADIGRLKCDVAQEHISSFNSNIKIQAINRKITSTDDIDELIFNTDVVICAIDEPPFIAQRLVNHVSVKYGIPCVYGLTQLTAGRVFTVLPNVSGCFDCLNIYYTKQDPQFLGQLFGFREAKFNPPTLTFGPDIMQLAAIMASEVIRVITGYIPPSSIGRQVEHNFVDHSTKVLTEWPRYENECPTCGKGNEIDWDVFGFYESAPA